MMSYDLSPEQEMLREEVSKFAHKELAPGALARSKMEPEELHKNLHPIDKQIVKLGWNHLNIPEKYGGHHIDHVSLGIIDKRRDQPNVSEVMHVIGDVKGKDTLIVDDLIDTAGTLTQAANALLKHGARSVRACATHPVLSGPAVQRIEKSDLTEVVVTNTIDLREEAKKCEKIRLLSVAHLFGEAINSIHNETSISSLFD